MAEADSRGKVLCVDDEPHILRALQWLLKKDFDVATATSAGEGLRLLRRGDFDVVISDQRMPGITGVEFLREVRKDSPRSVRILLTGYAELDAMVRSVNESEVFRFITKPWDVKGLHSLIAEAVSIANIDTVVVQDDSLFEALDCTSDLVAGASATSLSTSLPPSSPVACGTPVENNVSATQAALDFNVMVMDDDRAVHQAIDDAIGNSGQVLHAYSLAEAIRHLNETRVGVIISDIKVGRMDATRLIRMMKGEHPETISVVFSAVQDAEYVIKLINEGQVYRFIPKPFKSSFIKVVISSALKRHKQLLDNPQLLARFKVDAVAAGTSDSLLRDIEKCANAAPAVQQPAQAMARQNPQFSAANEVALVDKLKAGFRNLFRRA